MYQISRAKWLSFGDCNTQYFHGVTTIRSRKNTFEAIQDTNGNWVANSDELERLVTNFFATLFKDDTPRSDLCMNGVFPQFPTYKLDWFKEVISDEDIHKVVFSMGNFKALGKDGFQVVFYKS